MKRLFWTLVHKMPCRVQHLLCEQCREEGCGECLIRAFVNGTPVEVAGPPSLAFSTYNGIRMVPPSSTYTAGTTFTFVYRSKD